MPAALGGRLQHKFATLDGLRGVAAIAVMLFHRRDWFGGDAFLGHAYLAVDFFFMLSGFVIAHAYGERLRVRESFIPFVRDRIVRLHPTLVLGAVLALVVAVIGYRSGASQLGRWPALTFVAGALPIPAIWTGLPTAFPWNIAIWSLFWEIVANLLLAAGLIRLSNRHMLGLVVVSAVVLVGSSLMYDGLQVGFLNDPVQLALGLPRVCASFFAGVLLLRLHRRLPTRDLRLGGLCALGLLLSFAALPQRSPASGVYDAAVVLAVYPVMILLAASSTPWLPRVALLAGAVSYPLYVLHEPALKIVAGGLRASGLGTQEPGIAEALLRFGIVLLGSYAALRLYDEPLRAWLRRRITAPSGSASGSAARH